MIRDEGRPCRPSKIPVESVECETVLPQWGHLGYFADNSKMILSSSTEQTKKLHQSAEFMGYGTSNIAPTSSTKKFVVKYLLFLRDHYRNIVNWGSDDRDEIPVWIDILTPNPQ